MKNLNQADIQTYIQNIYRYGLSALEGVSTMHAAQLLEKVNAQRDNYVYETVKTGDVNPLGSYNYPDYVKAGEEWKYWLSKNDSYKRLTIVKYWLLAHLKPECMELARLLDKTGNYIVDQINLMEAVAKGEAKIIHGVVTTGKDLAKVKITQLIRSTNRSEYFRSINPNHDINIHGFAAYYYRMELQRQKAIEVAGKTTPAHDVIESLYAEYLTYRLDTISRSSITTNYLKLRSNLNWLIDAEEEANSIIKEHVHLFADVKDLQLAYLSICEGFVEWLEKRESVNSPKAPHASFKFDLVNNFDEVDSDEVVKYFTDTLVDKGYVTDEVLGEFLTAAFTECKPPNVKLDITIRSTKQKIIQIFYKYYKQIAGKPHRKQQDYAALLGDYFKGFTTKNVSTNFTK